MTTNSLSLIRLLLLNLAQQGHEKTKYTTSESDTASADSTRRSRTAVYKANVTKS